MNSLTTNFIKAQPRVIRPFVKTVVEQLNGKSIVMFNIIIKQNVEQDMSLSEATGRLRTKFIQTYDITLNSDYLTESAILVVITQLLRNSNLLNISKVLEKIEGKFITHYRCKINYTAPKKETRELSIPIEGTDNIKIKGHMLMSEKVPEHIMNMKSQFTLWLVKYRDERLFMLHAFLKFMKNKDKVSKGESPLLYKMRLFQEAKLGSYLVNSQIKLCKFFDSRGRGYPKVQFGTFKPFGDHFESRLIELEESYTVTQKDIDYTKWLIWTDLNGRMPIKQALAEYNEFTVLQKQNDNLIKINESHTTMLKYKTLKRGETVNEVITPNQLGDMLYFNECVTLIQNGIGSQSNLLVEVDMTNSGLIHFANMCRTPKLIQLANLTDTEKVYDSHTNLVTCMVTEIDKKIAELTKQLKG